MPSDEDVAILRTYAWPGNIRELAAVIDRAAIIGNGRRLEVAKALGVGTIAPASSTSNGQSALAAPVSPPEILPLDDAMKQHIEAALRHTHGRIEGPYGAARLLQINPHTLRARMRKLGIAWRRFRADEGP
jgi:hydrogenase-4 transcriptional activator